MKTTKILSASSFILLVCILAVASLYLLSPSARKVITEKGAYFSSFSEKLAFLGKGKELRRIDGVLDIQEIRSSEGIHAWLVQDESVPVISMHFAFSDAGSARDPLDKQGLARLVSNTMDEGAGNLNAEQFQAALRDDAIELSFFSSRDYYGGSLYTLSDNKNKAFKLLKMALTQPHYKEEALVRMRAANIARIRHSLSSPEWRILRTKLV